LLKERKQLGVKDVTMDLSREVENSKSSYSAFHRSAKKRSRKKKMSSQMNPS